MGITGLIPFLKKASHPASIKDWKGCTVAIDSYCWLHKGAFACADKLALGEPTDQYVYYCMKYVNNLLSYGIKPIMVFDGARLPSKEGVEKERRERRAVHRKKAAQLLREGKRAEARESLQRCVDITPAMALNLMNTCRSKGVDCIVAPYEADAQLAYLSRTGIAQVIITEDSDLLLFGCERVMFKMDFAGQGMMIQKKDLNKALDMKADTFTFDMFRYICILSGCDYLPSLSGIGLGKASKLFRLTRQTNIDIVLKKMPTTLKMPQLDVNEEYISGFHRALNTFLYQLVYDPTKRKLVPLTPYTQDINPRDLEYAGPYMSQEKAYQMALGNIDHYSNKHIADFDPDSPPFGPKNKQNSFLHMLSVWDPRYRPRPNIASNSESDMVRDSTRAHEVVTKWTPSSHKLPPPKIGVKRHRPEPEPEEEEAEGLDDDLIGVYKVESNQEIDPSPPTKRRKLWGLEEKEDVPPPDIATTPSPSSQTTTPSPTTKHRSCLQEIQGNNDTLPEPENDITSLAAPSMEEKPESQPTVKKGKSPRNKFATQDMVKKERFNLNTATTVRSRFFVQSTKLKPKTQFFQSLGDILPPHSGDSAEPALLTVKKESETSDDDPVTIETPVTIENPVTIETPKKPNDSLPSLPNIDPTLLSHGSDGSSLSEMGRGSPHASFAGWNKLHKFQSTFGKAEGIKSSPLTKKPFKPVTAFNIVPTKVAGGGGGDEEEKDWAEEEKDEEAGVKEEEKLDSVGTPDVITMIERDDAKTWPTKSRLNNLSSQPSLSQARTPLSSKKGCRGMGLSKSVKKVKAQGKSQQPLLTNFLNKFAFKKNEISTS